MTPSPADTEERMNQLPKPDIRVTAFGEIEPLDGRTFVMGDYYTADQMQEAILAERYIIDMLVAAGHVTAAKVAEARSIAAAIREGKG